MFPKSLLVVVACFISPVQCLVPLSMSRRAAVATAAVATGVASLLLVDETTLTAKADDDADIPSAKPKFQRYPQIRFISALGDSKASNGTGSENWDLWRDDPGPRGVYLRNYEASIKSHNNVAPAGWKFDSNDWWVEEHGLIMPSPDPLPRKRLDKGNNQILPYKRYVVTGDREVTTVLTVFEDGRWELQKGSLYDVTHLPCRSARYTSLADGSSKGGTCDPTAANSRDFPVKPGAEMPPIPGCAKQDYAVLFVLGEEV